MASPQIEVDGKGDFIARATHDLPAKLSRLAKPDRGNQRRIATEIGDHAIVELFDKQGIRDKLHDIFSTADWSHITVCRVGYTTQGPEDSPATILVGIRPNTMTTDQAVSMLNLAAQSVYRFHELRDVAIEMIEADVVSHAGESSRSELPGYGNYAYEFNEAFCNEPQIGVPLSPSDSTITGTLGGYLSIGTAPHVKYLALTCHHVLTRKFLSAPLTVTRLTPTNLV